MTKPSDLALGAVWEETTAFLKAEWGLVLPVAFLGFGLAMLIMLIAVAVGVPAEQAESGKIAVGPWMFAMIPAGLLSMTGSLAVSTLALRPGVSVGESLSLAIARLPAGIGLFALNIAVQLALAVPLVGIGLLEMHNSGATGPGSVVANLAVLAVTIWLFVRVMPIWALLTERMLGPWQAAVESFRLTQGHYPKLLLLRIVALVAGGVVLLVTLIPIGALFALVGKLTNADVATQLLSFIAVSGVFAVLVAIWTVYVARLYRRLAA